MVQVEVHRAATSSMTSSPIGRPSPSQSMPVALFRVTQEVNSSLSRPKGSRRSAPPKPRSPSEGSKVRQASFGGFSNVDSEVAVSRQLLRASQAAEASRSDVREDVQVSQIWPGAPGSRTPSSEEVQDFEDEVHEFLQLPLQRSEIRQSPRRQLVEVEEKTRR